jgi:hypothetical protein
MAHTARAWTAVGALTLTFTLGACSGPGTPDDEPTTASTSSPAAAATATATASAPPSATVEVPDETDTQGTAPSFDPPGTVSEADAGTGSLLTVTGIRVARHDDYDRVVFDLAGTGTPGWRVEYVDTALDDGSGLPVEVAGDHVLQVRISGTGIPADTGYDEFAGDPVRLDGDAVEEVVYRFTFEGYSTAFIGTDDLSAFRVFTLTNPTRLVVDVADDD